MEQVNDLMDYDDDLQSSNCSRKRGRKPSLEELLFGISSSGLAAAGTRAMDQSANLHLKQIRTSEPTKRIKSKPILASRLNNH